MEAIPEERTALRMTLNILQRILNSRTVQCFLVLHFLSWSADSTVSMALGLLLLTTMVYFGGCERLVSLAFHAASYFMFLIRILQGLFRVIFIFAVYELVLEIIGYHSEDYRKLKHNMQLFATEFTLTHCIWVVNMTRDDKVLLQPDDVVSLCSLMWSILYLSTIAVGLYMGMPDYHRVKKDYFWLNLYLGVMMLVVWKAFESFLWFGWWTSGEYHRATCLFAHYIRHGEDGFKAVSFTEARSQSKHKFS